MRAPVAIQSSEFWVKLVEMLQQNWALIDEGPGGAARVFFVTDLQASKNAAASSDAMASD